MPTNFTDTDFTDTDLHPVASHTASLQLLVSLWNLWQSLVAVGAAQLREASGFELREFIAASYLQARPYQPAELALELQMPRYEVSRLLKALETKGLVRRTRSLSDRRQILVELTPNGLSAWQTGLKTAEAVTAPYLAGLNEAGQQTLLLTLAQLVQPQQAAEAILQKTALYTDGA